MKRKITRAVRVGDVLIGADNHISIQSMTNTETADVKSTVSQILRLEDAGCELVRATVNNRDASQALKEIKKNIHIPLIADIHFDYRLALEAIKNGVDAVRINPGNIGDKDRVKKVIDAAKNADIPIRIGVNSGSIEKNIMAESSSVVEAMVKSALSHIKILEELDFYNTVVSLKSSDIRTCINAYENFSKFSDYPLHLGITESGSENRGKIVSSIGIGYLLLNGIGDTIRVSLTADPVKEVETAKQILRSLGLYKSGVEIISCPTCGRTAIDLISLSSKVEKLTANIKKPIKIALMGCAVNGPGEAKDADIGIAGGKHEAVLFKKGKLIKKISESEIIPILMEEIDKF